MGGITCDAPDKRHVVAMGIVVVQSGHKDLVAARLFAISDARPKANPVSPCGIKLIAKAIMSRFDHLPRFPSLD